MVKPPLSDEELKYIDRPREIEIPVACIKERDRLRIQQEIDAFLAGGGTIQEVDSSVMVDQTLTLTDPFSIKPGSANDLRANRPERMSINSAAVYLRMHHATLRHGIRKGYLPDGTAPPKHHTDDKGTYFKPDDLDDWLETIAPTRKKAG